MCLPADLLVRKELDSRIGHNPDTVGAIALKHSSDALFVVHVFASLQELTKVSTECMLVSNKDLCFGTCSDSSLAS